MLYARRDTKLASVDPRLKVAWVLACNAVAIVAADLEILLATVTAIVAVALIGGVLMDILRRFKGFWMLMLVIGLIQGLTIAQGEVVVYLIPKFVPVIGGSLPIYSWGLYYGLLSTLRLFALTMPVFVMVATSSISELVGAFSWMGLPYEYSLMLSLALSFIPLFLSELSSMMEALKTRGCELVEGNILQRAYALKYVLIPLSLNAVERADTVGKVLEMRGYANPEGLKRALGEKKLTVADFTFALFIALQLAAVIAL